MKGEFFADGIPGVVVKSTDFGERSGYKTVDHQIQVVATKRKKLLAVKCVEGVVLLVKMLENQQSTAVQRNAIEVRK